jgi:hypothetical protein
MIRGLVVVAVGGAVLSALCIGASGAVSPHHWHVPSMNWTIDDEGEGPSLRLNGNEPVITRDLARTGGESLTFDVPAKITFTQGPVARMTLSGPDALVNHVVLVGDRMKLDRSLHGLTTRNALKVAITAPNLHDFHLESAQTLDINNLATDQFSVEIDGAGKVNAHGTAKSVKLEIDGAADADFSDLAVGDAKIEIDGLGHVIAGPTGDAHVEIDGAGKVTLTKRPAHLSQEINGAGSISQPDAPAGQAL